MNKNIKELFISKSGNTPQSIVTGSLRTSGSDASFNSSLVKGDVYLVDANMNIITATPTTDNIYVVQCFGNKNVKISSPIPLKGIKKIKKEVYTPFVSAVYAIGYDAIANPTATIPFVGPEVFTMSIELNSEFRTAPNRNTKRAYSYTSNLTNTSTIAEIRAFIDQFVSEINNDVTINKFITATRVDNGTSLIGINITTINQDSEYAPFLSAAYQVVVNTIYYKNNSNFFLKVADVKLKTASVRGSGSYVQVADEEENIQAYRRVTNQIDFPIPKAVMFSEKETNYNMYSIMFDEETYQINAKGQAPQVIKICTDVLGVSAGTADVLINTSIGILAGSTQLTDVAETVNS